VTALRLTGGVAARDARAYLARVHRLDPAALVRLRSVRNGTVALWTQLPVDVLAMRAVPGDLIGADDVVVAVRDLLDRLDGTTDGTASEAKELLLTAGRDADWRASLPGDGFQRLDEVPATELERLARAGARTFEAAQAAGTGRSGAGARALTEAVLDHIALRVEGRGGTAEVPQRLVQALGTLGFLGLGLVAVDVSPTWVRLVATYGSVHRHRTDTPRLALRPVGR